MSEPERHGDLGRGAVAVGSGILASRVFGLVRERALAHYFGVGLYADVVAAALRIPNVIQNLLGEQTLSAAFIPTYARFVAAGRRETAGRFAGAIFGLLLALAGALSVAGVVFARPLTVLLTPGLLADSARVASGAVEASRFELLAATVRWIFPMSGLLVLSAWALGVLNSHGRFFLSYVAPVAWNVAIITALVLAGQGWVSFGGGGPLDRMLLAVAIGALAGGARQFAVQLPWVAREMTGFRLSLSTRVEGVRESLRAFGPAVAGRGVVQISSFLDQVLASFLAIGGFSALRYAQTLYLLPVSLFGMSLAAAALPRLAREHSGDDDASRARLAASVRLALRQNVFLNLPTAAAYLAFGFLIVGGLYRTGSFQSQDSWLVYLVLASYTLGLVASTSSRQLQSAFFALGDTATPARIAFFRVGVGVLVGVPAMKLLDRWTVPGMVGPFPGAEALHLGAIGLGLGASVAAWCEWTWLSRALERRIGPARPDREFLLRLTLAGALAALPAAAGAWAVTRLEVPPLLGAASVLLGFAVIFLLAAHRLRVPEATRWIRRLRPRQP